MIFINYFELDKKVKFEIMLFSASMREKRDAKEVCKLFFVKFEIMRISERKKDNILNSLIFQS